MYVCVKIWSTSRINVDLGIAQGREEGGGGGGAVRNEESRQI